MKTDTNKSNKDNQCGEQLIDTLQIKLLDFSVIREKMKKIYLSASCKSNNSQISKLLQGFPSKNALEFAFMFLRNLPILVSPDQLVDEAIQTIKSMKSGYTLAGIPISSVNKNCHPLVANELIFSDLPKITEAVFPTDFASVVQRICSEKQAKGPIF